MAKVDSTTDDNLYDGTFFVLSSYHPFLTLAPGLYGDEFEEDFVVSALGNSSAITDSAVADGATEFIEPPEDLSASIPLEVEAAQPIPTFDSTASSRPRTNADALPPRPNTLSGASNAASSPLSYSAQVAEQFSSSYRQTPSQERGRLDAARLAQFNQPGAPSGSMGATGSPDGLARPVRPSEMKDEGCVFPLVSPFVPVYPSWFVCDEEEEEREKKTGGGEAAVVVCHPPRFWHRES